MANSPIFWTVVGLLWAAAVYVDVSKNGWHWGALLFIIATVFSFVIAITAAIRKKKK